MNQFARTMICILSTILLNCTRSVGDPTVAITWVASETAALGTLDAFCAAAPTHAVYNAGTGIYTLFAYCEGQVVGFGTSTTLPAGVEVIETLGVAAAGGTLITATLVAGTVIAIGITSTYIYDYATGKPTGYTLGGWLYQACPGCWAW